MEYFGNKVWVTKGGAPVLKNVPRKSIPPLTAENTTSNLVMQQENENGSGKYFNERLLTFKDKPKKWVILYETKQLKLMNSAKKYCEIWQHASRTNEEIASIKLADHILEISTTNGPLVLEGLFHSSDKSSLHGRFLVMPYFSEKKLFETEFAGPGNTYPLLRQSSNEQRKSTDFHVSCRPTTARGIDMIFIVHPKHVVLDLPPKIDRETYKRLLNIREVLMFKQATPLKL